MAWPVERVVTSGVVLALVILLAIGYVSYHSLSSFIASAEEAEKIHITLEKLESVVSRVTEAESAQRGFLITGDESYLEPFQSQIEGVYADLGELHALIGNNTDQQSRLARLELLIRKRHELLKRNMEVRRRQGFPASQQIVVGGQGKETMDEIREVVAAMKSRERQSLAHRRHAADQTGQQAILVGFFGTAVAFVLLGVAGFMVRHDAVRRRDAEEALRRLNQMQGAALDELEKQGRELALLSELGDLLQGCQSLEEAHRVVAQSMGRLFPTEVGALGVINPSRNHIEVVATWGGAYVGEKVFHPDDCWGLRRGRIHRVEDPASAQHCAHVGHSLGRGYVCVPMMGQGEALGVLHLQGSPEQPRAAPEVRVSAAETKLRLAQTVAEHIAMAVANLKLRETLRQRSIRDPLTGLFNRRFLEESLEREVRRAERNQRSLGVVMLDYDHFKRFNDTFGHEAGDLLLRRLGELLLKTTRRDDIACRYGGEEFVLILPEATLESAEQRAEQLRRAVHELDSMYRGQTLGPLTASLGVAAFPVHGKEPEDLLRAADAALYRSKKDGRNRVTVAESVAPEDGTDA